MTALPLHTHYICLISSQFWTRLGSILPNAIPLDEKTLQEMMELRQKSNYKETFIILVINDIELSIASSITHQILQKMGSHNLGVITLTDRTRLEHLSQYTNIMLPRNIDNLHLLHIVNNLFSQLELKAENLRLNRDLALNEKELKRIIEISKALTAERNFEKFIGMLLIEGQKIVNADSGSIYVVESNKPSKNKKNTTPKQYLRFKKSSIKDTKQFILPINRNSIAGYVALTGNSLIIPDVYNLPEDYPFNFNQELDRKNNYHTKSMLVLPMINPVGEIMGVLQLINRKRYFGKNLSLDDMRNDNEVLPFNEKDLQLASALASQSAIALYNQKLLDGQRNLLETFIHLIASAIDSKSAYTGEHCRRVPILTELLTQAACDCKEGNLADFNLSEDDWYELRIAAGLHDCGKIVTPVHVIDKSSKLETIFNRLEIVKLRLEILRREAKKEHIKNSLLKKLSTEECNRILQRRLASIASMEIFLEKVNTGGESLDEKDIERIHKISKLSYFQNGKRHPLLTENEVENLVVKRGTLTKKERLVINSHMVETIKILEALPFPPNLEHVPEYACGHHEKMDGTGYPRGIFAADMSVPARIMAIADVFEALTAVDRPYKKGKTLTETMEIMGEMKRNNHLDPELFNLFVKSKIHLIYAERYLPKELLGEVDEEQLLKIQAKGFTLPPEEERKKRWDSLLPEYANA